MNITAKQGKYSLNQRRKAEALNPNNSFSREVASFASISCVGRMEFV